MIVLIRHAEAQWIDPETASIVREPRLTDRGYDQAACLRARLVGESFGALATSPLIRARDTYRIVANADAGPEDIEEWLREIRYPDWHGWDPDVVLSLLRGHDSEDVERRWAGLDGGESLRSYTQHVRGGALNYFKSQGMSPVPGQPELWDIQRPEQDVCLIGHAGSLSILMSVMLGLSSVAWERQRFAMRHAAITRLVPVPVGRWFAFGVEEFGDDGYLPPELRSA